MDTYFILKETSRHQIPVWRARKGTKKTILYTHAFTIDVPGSIYCDDHEYNCHVDGEDHYADSFAKALEIGYRINGYNLTEYRVVYTTLDSENCTETELIDTLKKTYIL